MRKFICTSIALAIVSSGVSQAQQQAVHQTIATISSQPVQPPMPSLTSASPEQTATSIPSTPMPGDAYWTSGATGMPTSTSLGAHLAPGTIPGDAYWPGATVGPSISPDTVWATSADDVSSGSVFSGSASGESNIPLARANLIQEAAVAFGAQAGMAARTRALNNAVQINAASYDRVFRFSDLMIEPGFLAPVVSEGRDAYTQPNSREVRVADRIYRIERPERLVSTPPRWQEYMIMQPSAPLAPDRLARPRTTAERSWWDRWSRVGWARGVAQADQSFQSRMGRLRRDFEGMVRFKALYQQGVITMPILARTNMGVTGGGAEMAIGDRVYRITQGAELDPNTQRWKSGVPVTNRTDLPPSAIPVEPER